jgi:hypothetical protein
MSRNIIFVCAEITGMKIHILSFQKNSITLYIQLWILKSPHNMLNVMNRPENICLVRL